MRRPPDAGEGGAVALATLTGGAAVAVAALVVVLAAADVGVAAARARTAADAAALAAAAASPLAGGDGDHTAAAARVAGANGATVTATDDGSWPLRVRVRVAVPPRAPVVRALAGPVSAEAVAAVRPPDAAPSVGALGLTAWPGAGLAGGPSPVVAADARALLANPRVSLPPRARADLAAGVVDARVVAVLATIAQRHTVGVSVFRSGHTRFVAGTRRESNHYHGRAVDIAVVDGRPVRPGHAGARAIAAWLATLRGPLRPTEVGSPFADLAGRAAGHFTDAAHHDHLHLGWRGG